MLSALVLAASLAAPMAQDSLAPVRRADSLRVAILSVARFVHLDTTQCNQGVLRTFPDSARTPGAPTAVESLARLERLVIAEGVENPVDNPRGHALLRGVVGWEVGMARPRWDVADGAPTYKAIAAGLAGEFWNPDTKACESFVPEEPHYVLLPPLTNFTMPRPPRTELTIGFGERGLFELRDKFFASHRGDSTAVLTYAHVIATVLWRDYALVAVNRPAEQMGAMPLRQGAGGSTYLFHFANGEWRLLAIVRTWT
ncbi:MAG: hypothetical protein C0497_06685 [Gemmatimonas sp.]|nr:hypothetical protein [Gemmatimonas sp.]